MAGKRKKARVCATFRPPGRQPQQQHRGRGYTVTGERWQKAENPPEGLNQERYSSRSGGGSGGGEVGRERVPRLERKNWYDSKRGRGGVSVGRGRGLGVGVGWTPTQSVVRTGRGRNVRENDFGLGGEEGASAHKADKQEPERVGVGKKLGESEDKDRETGSPALMDNRTERLGRYLSARLNVDSDSGEENGGFLLGDEEDVGAVSDISSGDCVSDCHPRFPAVTKPATHKSSESTFSRVVKSNMGGVGRMAGCSDFTLFEDASDQSRDGTGPFEDKCSFGQAEKDPPLLGGEGGRGQVSNGEGKVEQESEDDGWNSEADDFTSNFPSHSGISCMLLLK